MSHKKQVKKTQTGYFFASFESFFFFFCSMFLPSVNPFGSLVDLFYIFKSKSESGLFLAFHRLCHAIILCFSYFCSQLLPDVTPAVFAGLSQGAVALLGGDLEKM